MFNFREEFEQIKKASTDIHLYLAEEFLQEAIKRLKESNLDLLRNAKTFDVQYSDVTVINNTCSITAGFNNSIGFSKIYHVETGKKVFEKIEEALNKTCFGMVRREKEYIHVQL